MELGGAATDVTKALNDLLNHIKDGGEGHIVRHLIHRITLLVTWSSGHLVIWSAGHLSAGQSSEQIFFRSRKKVRLFSL
jgi:hypothetical protein